MRQRATRCRELIVLVLIVAIGIPTGSGADADYPDATYLKAWGHSSVSLADAVNQARAEIAAQIDASVRARGTSHAEATSRDGRVDDFQHLTSTIETFAHFDRAELIEIDASRSGPDSSDGFRAFVYVRRRVVAEAYVQDYRAHRVGFRAAMDAVATGSSMPLAESWSRACEHFEPMADIADTYRAVVGNAPPDYSIDREAYLQLDAVRRATLGDTRIAVSVTCGDPRVDRSAIEAEVLQALRGLGVGATAGNCSGDTALRLTLDVRVRQRRMLGGTVWHPWLAGVISGCSERSSSGAVRIESSHFDVRGHDARSRLASGLEASALRPVIADALAGWLPLRASVLRFPGKETGR